MKAAVVHAHGDKDPAVEIKDAWPKPVRDDGKTQLLIRVLACSTAYGDAHMLSGRLSMVFKPPSWPYVPGKDVCGVIEEADTTSKFKPGDIVVSSSDYKAIGGMAEYIVTDEAHTSLKPPEVDVLSAAASADSPVVAVLTSDLARFKPGDRVLVLGGSGGVGSCVVQLVKLAQPSLLVATSTQEDMVKKLGADVVLNYTTTNWWEAKEYLQQPFDVIVDCVGGNSHFSKACKVLKSKMRGGRFVAVVGDVPQPVVKNVLQLLQFALGMLWKPIWTLFHPGVPAYKMVVSASTTQNQAKALALMQAGKLKIAMEPASPLPFTQEGVKTALALQASYHAHGKIVVKIGEP